MALDGTFLRSKVGRRMFFALLLAAALPIAFFGALSYRELNDYASAQTQRQLSASTKYAALGTLNRLILARALLGVMSRQSTPGPDDSRSLDGGRALSAVAVVSKSGKLLAGNDRLAELWKAGRAIESANAEQLPGLWWPRVDAASTAPSPVVVSRVAMDGSVWLGEVDSAYLFDSLAADMAGGDICVFDMRGNALSCPSVALQSARQRLRDNNTLHRGGSATWNLFLRSEFGVEDWILVTLTETSHVADASESVAKSAAQVALATLLIVTLLSLVQIRRTTVPLERLINGTRRLGQRDFSARVTVDRDDEFGELAGSFNQMAAKIGRQIDALQVQSVIDAEILDRLDVAQVMQHVIHRIEAVIPGVEVVIVELDRGSSRGSIVHHRGETAYLHGVAESAAGTDPDSDGWREWRAGDQRPDWLRRIALANTTSLETLTVIARGELMAWLVIAASAPARIDDDTAREVCELRDRVGVTLSSAHRERQLVARATTDSLTGLLNRSGLSEAFRKRTETRAGADPEPLNLLFIDLDRFKDVNDLLGHEAGDELLCIIARRLVACAPAASLLARPGGDEFVLITPGARELAMAIAMQICAVLAEAIPLRGQVVAVGASIGLVRYPEHGTALEDLLRRGDMAMYVAKASGRGQQKWFEPALDARQSDRMAMLHDLQQALVRNQFELQYQPRVNTLDTRVCTVEALIRWRHPTRGLVSPAQFIELLEETGLIESVGQWVLSTACHQLRHWRTNGLQLGSVAVNVSARQILAPNYADQVLATIASAKLAPGDIELEVTESMLVDRGPSTTGSLQRLRDAGMRIAIDDFGTGYSSLSYLHRLPFDVLKVDRAFVKELGVTANAESITRAIVALARTLNKRVVAEGVETEDQACHLREIGCDELQGYYYSRPLAPQALVTWLSARSAELVLDENAA